MKKNRLVLVLFSILFSILLMFSMVSMVLFLLSGFERLESKRFIIDKVTDSYENCEFVNMEKEINDYGFPTRIYTFKSNDLEFQFTNYLDKSNTLFAFTESYIETNYLTRFFELRKDNIENLFKKYNILVWDASLKENHEERNADFDEFSKFRKEKNTYIVCHVGNNFYSEWNDDIDFTFYINKYDDIKVVYDFLSDLHEEFEGYFYKNINDYFYCPSISVGIEYQDRAIKESEVLCRTIFYEDWWFRTDDFDLDGVLEEIQHSYKEDVKYGYINDGTVDISDVKPTRIEKIYVNNTLFENINKNGPVILSESYCRNNDVLNIIYLTKEDRYYIEVGFGISEDEKLKGTQIQESWEDEYIDDYFQRKILMQCYPDCEYTIKNKTTTYKIGEDNFKIVRKTLLGGRDIKEFKFYKNGKEIEINQFEKIEEHRCKYYTQFISIEDFAKIMGLEIEKYDYKNATIYFTKK